MSMINLIIIAVSIIVMYCVARVTSGLGFFIRSFAFVAASDYTREPPDPLSATCCATLIPGGGAEVRRGLSTDV